MVSKISSVKLKSDTVAQSAQLKPKGGLVSRMASMFRSSTKSTEMKQISKPGSALIGMKGGKGKVYNTCRC